MSTVLLHFLNSSIYLACRKLHALALDLCALDRKRTGIKVEGTRPFFQNLHREDHSARKNAPAKINVQSQMEVARAHLLRITERALIIEHALHLETVTFILTGFGHVPLDGGAIIMERDKIFDEVHRREERHSTGPGTA